MITLRRSSYIGLYFGVTSIWTQCTEWQSSVSHMQSRFIHCFSCHSWLTHHSNCLNIIHDIHNASKTKTNSGLVWCISNSPEATPKYFSRSLVGNLAPCSLFSLKRASSRQCTLDMGVHDCVLVQFGWFLYSCSVHNLSYCLSVLFY